MTDAWFAPDFAYYFSGAGLLSLTALAAPVIARGKHRRAIISLWSAIIIAGLALLIAGIIAWLGRQPNHVTAPLLMTGFAIAAAYGFSMVFVLRVYRLAEQRKIAAKEL
jgi:hypothetical protein